MDVAELVFRRGDKDLLHLRLDRAEVCIGSNPTNDVVVPDASVPEVAALLIDRGAHRYRLRDLTQELIQINGVTNELDEVDIGEGDVITVGVYSLLLRVRPDAATRQRFGKTSVMGQENRSQDHGVLTYAGQRHDVSADRPFNIGGDDDNDLRVEDPFVSTFHCRITNQGGRWFLSDLDSTNGTEVNGLRVREAELPLPASIRLGKAVLTFEVERADAEETRGETMVFRGMIAVSDKMRRVFELTERYAEAREPVLVIGGSGCGKELVARALHDESPRGAGPYLALNCGALNSGLIEAELFGHVKGAFTGAMADKPGAFEATGGGSLFLDEIGELPLDLQPKLLRVLESSTIRRVGGTKEIPVDTRIIAATHRNLEELVREGSFREDLFHRLFVLSIPIPSLSDRPDDILPLAQHFIRSQAPETMELSPEAEDALLDYTWPGNIRELRNVVVRAILMAEGTSIQASDLQFSRDAFTTRSRDARRSVRRHEEAERQKILEALDRAAGNRAEAGRSLGISKSTFHDRLKRYGIPLKFGERK